MKILHKILLIVSIILINSCHSSKLIYPKNTLLIYDDGVDSMEVYVHKYLFWGGVIVKDKINIDSSFDVGRANKKHLLKVDEKYLSLPSKRKKMPSPKY